MDGEGVEWLSVLNGLLGNVAELGLEEGTKGDEEEEGKLLTRKCCGE